MDGLALLLPEIVLTAGALGVMLWDLWLPREKKGVLAYAAMALCVALFALTFVEPASTSGSGWLAFWVVDGLSLLMKRAFCVCAFLVFFLGKDYVREFGRGDGEYYTISLFALLGMFMCSSVADFMSLFVALEIVTVSFFVLVAFKRSDPKSVEAGLKLLVIGSVSAAILLYGIAFVYGATGSLVFSDIRSTIGQTAGRPEMILGALMIFLGLGFKTSAVPLHVWVPDVYQGAPTPVTAFLSVGSKLAGFVLVLRCFWVFTGGIDGGISMQLVGFFGLVAAITLFYGNLGAIPQSNIKRLLGYSSIGQCGYLLIGIAGAAASIAAHEPDALGISGVLFYMTSYVLTNLAGFLVIVYVGRIVGSDELEDYAGLARRSPLLALTMTAGLLSLAGVPPFIGFFGKFMLIGSAFEHPATAWLAVCGLINVVIALYYYLCVIKRLYVFPPRDASQPRLRVGAPLAAVMLVAVVLLIAGGIAPQMLEKHTAPVAEMLVTPDAR